MIAVAAVAPILGMLAWYRRLSYEDRETVGPFLGIGVCAILLWLVGLVIVVLSAYSFPDFRSQRKDARTRPERGTLEDKARRLGRVEES
jgi:hypothetical protein